MPPPRLAQLFRPRYQLPSLRGQLLRLLLGTLGILWLGTLGFAFVHAHEIADEIADRALARTASLLLGVVHSQGKALPALQEPYPIAFQVWSGNTLLLRSEDAPETSPLTTEEGFSEAMWQGALWRFYTVQDDHVSGHRAQVAQRHDLRYAVAQATVTRLLLPFVLGLPILALAVWLAVGRAMGPLATLADTVARRRSDDFSPLPIQAPAEAVPLQDALNALFRRIDDVLQQERAFTAHAAHELRTPLAALMTQAQVAQRAQDEPTRSRALTRVQEGVERMTRLTRQLLTLARLDPDSVPRASEGEVCRVATLLEEAARIGDAPPLQALAEKLEITVAAPPDLALSGNREWLRMALRNLVDNAIRYGGQDTAQGDRPQHLYLEAGRTPLPDGRSEIWIRVRDEGPGIPAARREEALGRFSRLDGRGEGSGLGLPIVARIAALHGARLHLGPGDPGNPDTPGLAVSLIFPAV